MGRRIHSALLKFVCRFGFASLLIGSATQANVLRVDVTGIRNDDGVIYCQLFSGANGFPRKVSKTTAVVRAQIQDGSATCVFPNVSQGSYAVAVYHDENGNGRLDRGFMGIPKEGVGVSNDAQRSWGVPNYDQAKFVVEAEEERIVVPHQVPEKSGTGASAPQANRLFDR
jgi:uncharacterized protein (DUF2141 family)